MYRAIAKTLINCHYNLNLFKVNECWWECMRVAWVLGSVFPSLNAGGWKRKEGLTQIAVWAHVKKPRLKKFVLRDVKDRSLFMPRGVFNAIYLIINAIFFIYAIISGFNFFTQPLLNKFKILEKIFACSGRFQARK